jgi:hypothetical protein
MNVKELREAIEDARALVAACDGKEPKALKEFLQIFEGHDELSVEQFLEALRGRTLAPTTSPEADDSSNPGFDSGLVSAYIQQLKDAGISESAFNIVFARIKKDKAVKTTEAFAISHGYAGGRATWSTKGEALDNIERWFRHLAYQAAKRVRVA